MLHTKLYIPRWQTGLVARQRLIERVRAGAERRLTVLSAPAGSGKTTLLAEWLAGRSSDEPPAAWVSLDAGDNDPAVFWTYVVTALRQIEPGVGQQIIDALPAEPAPSVPMLTALLNDIARIDHDVVLILDDYHVIDAAPVQTALAFFLDNLPPNMHLVLATRADPVLPLPRLRARGELTELRVTDLRFTTEETSTFLNRVMTLDLESADVTELEKRTEGWIAGLKLAALSMQGQDDVPAFIRSFSGDNRYIADYLVEEVLNGQPERMRRFLLGTAILERMSAPLCDAVTGETGSQALLESLEKTNLFVIALDDRREWYRYHHLFAEVLQAHALRAEPAHVREMHARASTWFAANGATADAVRHALLANDVQRVAELLEQNWPARDRSYASARWLTQVKALPRDIVRARPMLNLGYAWALLNAGELEAAEPILAEVEAALDPTALPMLARELAAARVYLAQSRGDVAGTAELAQRVLDLVPDGDHAARATAAALLALAYWANGDLDDAYSTFASALAAMRLAGADLDAIRGEFVLGDIRATQGRLRDAARIYEGGLALAAAHPHAETDELYMGLSEVHRERGELAEATELLHKVEQRTTRAVHAGNRHRCCIVMSRIAEAHGDLDRALSRLEMAEGFHRRDPLPVVRPIAAMKARIRIAQGNIADAVRWANEHGLDAGDEPSFLREYEYVTLARLLIAQNRLEPAAALLERLTAAARTGGRTGSVIETLVLQGIVRQKLGDARAALDAIASALELAEPEAYVRVFVDEGTIVRDLLRQATARGVAGAYTRRILAAFDGVQPEQAAKPAGVALEAERLLTTREHEILRLIAAGMRNQEIATQLFISPATVKRHIANVYTKLDASHRTDALKRAGTLNLL